MRVKKLESTATLEDCINKVNELIEKVNSIKSDVYIGPAPNPYDLNAVGRLLNRHKKR